MQPISVQRSQKSSTAALPADECRVTRARLSGRRCFGCDATSGEAAFTGDRKPIGQRDLCFACQSDPPALAAQQVADRRKEIAARRSERRANAAKNRPSRAGSASAVGAAHAEETN